MHITSRAIGRGFTWAGALFSFALWLVVESATNIAWVGNWPWGWIFAISAAFLLGSEAFSRDAWSRAIIRYFRSFGEFSDIQYRKEPLEFDDNHGGARRSTLVFLTFTFTKKCYLDAISVHADCYRFLKNSIKEKVKSYEWRPPTEINKLYLNKSQIEIPIAYIPEDKMSVGVYGDMSANGYCLSHATAHDIDIELHANGYTQLKTIRIYIPPTSFHNDYPRLDPDRFVVLESDNGNR